MRIDKKQRKYNVKQWYKLLQDSYNNTSAVVIKRCESKNPNIHRVQLLTCNAIGVPVIIADSIDGLTGCLYELCQNINPVHTVKTYYENGFADWLYENYNLCLSYNDGLVLMFKRATE